MKGLRLALGNIGIVLVILVLACAVLGLLLLGMDRFVAEIQGWVAWTKEST